SKGGKGGPKGTPPRPTTPALPYEDIKTAWNGMAATCGLPSIRSITKKRKAALRQRWADPDWRDGWRTALDTIPNCPFLVSGEVGGTWTADFDWFVKPDSVTKIAEGKYADRNGQPQSDPSSRVWGPEK
ncbi:hypothetical protein ACFL09_04025, partial [Planctomycetota bacterium]